jgi:hypothetical protein
MQPVKNGRTDMPAGVALLEGPSGGASDGQLQARPAAPDQLQLPPAANRPIGRRPLALALWAPVNSHAAHVVWWRVAAQALQEAGYLAQMQDAQASSGLSGMATGLSMAGSEMMPPPMGNAGELSSIATLSNPDAKPS